MEKISQQYLNNIKEKIDIGKSHPSIIKLSPQESFHLKGEKYDLNIHYSLNLQKKTQHTNTTKHNPFLPPFEDGKHVIDLENTHRLLYNKFPIKQGHVLIVTKEFEQQNSPLTKDDYRQIVVLMRATKGCYFFNSGQNAGTTQPHKHFQCLPEESKQQLPTIKLFQSYAQTKIDKNQCYIDSKFQPFDFQNGFIALSPCSSIQQQIQKGYKAYQQLHKKLISTSNPSINIDHSLIGSQNFMLIIPRKSTKILQSGANSVSFFGYIFVKQLQQFNLINKLSVQDILGSLSFRNKQQLQEKRKQLIKQ